MRIRKRSEPLDLSLLSPISVPVSDPPLSKEDQVEEQEQVQEPEDQSKTHLYPHQSDSLNQSLRLTIMKRNNGWICPDGDTLMNKKEYCMFPSSSQALQVVEQQKEIEQEEHYEDEEEEEKKKRWGENYNSKNNRKGSRLGAETNSRVQPHSSFPSDQANGRWVEGEKLIPLKKRRGNFERKVLREETMIEKEKKMKSKLKTKTTKKWVHEKDQEKGIENGLESTNVNKKRSIDNGGGDLMEGSRCSRINGRGWRCFQQTLVGYSLCEHHLGKGRLRSVSSVRNKASSVAVNRPKKVLEHDEDQEEEPLIVQVEKRKKIATVKTRSISSLLGQTHLASNVAPQTLPACDGTINGDCL